MGGIVSCISNLLYISEKITLCTAFTCLTCCLVLTITMTLGMGIGLGYNYCFVDMRTKFKHVRSHYVYPGSPRWPYKRAGHVVEEPEIEEISEDDARRPYYIPEELPTMSDVIMTPKTFRDKLRSNFTSTENEVKMTIKAANNDTIAKVATTAISERTPESTSSTSTTFPQSSSTNDSTSSLESSSKTTRTTESKSLIKSETKERNPDPHIVKNSNSKKVKKLVIPITGLDLISLLSRLSAENRNYSLQVVTT